jgi:integrase
MCRSHVPDEKAVERDLPDLTLFILGTGVRIGEALAVLCHQVDFDSGCVEVTHTLIRVKGKGLVRKKTKSRAGERLLKLPLSSPAVSPAGRRIGRLEFRR